MLKVENLTLHLKDQPLLSDVSVDLKAGELAVVLGPNGAGKSSLIKCISGDYRAHSGRITWQGKSLTEMSPRERAILMAVLPQKSILEFPFTASEVVALGRIPHDSGAEKDQVIVDEALALLDVSHLKNRLFTELSGGERQRVQLARTMAQLWPTESQQNGLLILDEPIDGLDLAHQRLVMELLKQRARNGDSVLVVLHDLNFASEFADQIWLMRCGSIYSSGTPEQVLRTEALEEIFQLRFHAVNHPDDGRKVFLN